MIKSNRFNIFKQVKIFFISYFYKKQKFNYTSKK